MKKRGKKLGIAGTKCGAINFFQRHRSSLLLFPHNHLIALDGVYDVKDAEVPVFHPLPAPDNADIAWVTNEFPHRMLGFLKDKGFVRDFDDDGIDVA